MAVGMIAHDVWQQARLTAQRERVLATEAARLAAEWIDAIGERLAGNELYTQAPQEVAPLQARYAQIEDELMAALERDRGLPVGGIDLMPIIETGLGFSNLAAIARWWSLAS